MRTVALDRTGRRDERHGVPACGDAVQGDRRFAGRLAVNEDSRSCGLRFNLEPAGVRDDARCGRPCRRSSRRRGRLACRCRARRGLVGGRALRRHVHLPADDRHDHDHAGSGSQLPRERRRLAGSRSRGRGSNRYRGRDRVRACLEAAAGGSFNLAVVSCGVGASDGVALRRRRRPRRRRLVARRNRPHGAREDGLGRRGGGCRRRRHIERHRWAAVEPGRGAGGGGV